jgi:hypothetical protein
LGGLNEHFGQHHIRNIWKIGDRRRPRHCRETRFCPEGSVDVAAILDDLAAHSEDNDLDWRKSIVDLMKILKLDSRLAARKQLAQELHYTGSTKNSAEMNMWLHKQVMAKLVENGGKLPSDLHT